mgnify:CR=1 FL=1
MKKDKKAPDETLAPDEEALDKDYQQEEDEDVKEKHKLAKIIIAVILFIIIFFIILLIRNIHEKTKEQFYDVNGVESVEAVAKANEGGTDEEVDGCLLDLTGPTVVVTVPLKYYENKQPADTLTDEEIKNGYVDVKKVGGNVVYTIKSVCYPSIVSSMYELHSDEYQEENFLKENDLLRFAQFSYMQKFTVTLGEDEKFIPDKYYKLLLHTYNQSAIYQSYLGIQPQDINVNFQFKYTGAQFPFVEYKFPDILGRSLASVPVNMREGTAPNSAAKRFGFTQ